ncbi:hypothetical protein ABXK36_37450, partial [Bacillus cereus]
FLFSTTVHEAAHSFVSYFGGDRTAAAGGQATLNPLPHIRRSVFGMVVATILTYIMSGGAYLLGWASAPFNIHWAARYPKRSFLMSLAGPLSHLPLTLFGFFSLYYGFKSGYFVFGGVELLFPAAPALAGDSLAWALALFAN